MDYPEAEKGKCQTCGLLAKNPTPKYAALPTLGYYEIDPYTRAQGSHSHLFKVRPDLAGRQICETDVVCFINVADLMDGVRDIPDDGRLETAEQRRTLILAAIAADRHCASWYPHTPGFSPRGHYQQLQMQRLEDDRRAFEMKLFELGQKAEENSLRVAQDSKELVAELREIAKKSDKSSRRIAWLVILLAIAQVIVGFLALYHESYTDQFLRRVFGPLSR